MSETLEYIDRYFNGELSLPEKKDFENRCEADPVFAQDVAFYIQVRAGLKTEIYQQKTNQFAEQYTELSTAAPKSTHGVIRRMMPAIAAAAAACLVIFIGWQFFSKEASSQQIAEQYIDKNMKVLSVPMGTTRDSVDLAITAYNDKNYKQAETILQAVASNHPDNAEAVKYLGIVYLVTGNYDQAIIQFETLSKNSQLFANPGLFYKAVSLMKRDKHGDKENAKRLLNEVITNDLQGKKEAEAWVNKL
ncbi:MAG: tetratricopeptide repeat protein [Flavisolibacter sp.]